MVQGAIRYQGQIKAPRPKERRDSANASPTTRRGSGSIIRLIAVFQAIGPPDGGRWGQMWDFSQNSAPEGAVELPYGCKGFQAPWMGMSRDLWEPAALAHEDFSRILYANRRKLLAFTGPVFGYNPATNARVFASAALTHCRQPKNDP